MDDNCSCGSAINLLLVRGTFRWKWQESFVWRLGTILSICCVSNCCLSLLNVIWLRFLMVKTPPLPPPPPPKKKEKIGIAWCHIDIFQLRYLGYGSVFVQRQVPVNLLRASRVFVFEPPPGVKANLLRTFSAVPAARMCKVSHNLYYFSRANNVMVHLEK